MKTNAQAFGNPIVTMNNMMLIGDGGVSDAVRLRLPTQRLIDTNDVTASFISLGEFESLDQVLRDGHDALSKATLSVLTRPAIPELLTVLKENYGHTIIADVDDDFHSIPKSHPGYMAVGPGNPSHLEKHRVCLQMADMVTCTTNVLAFRLGNEPLLVDPKKIRVIPNGWGLSDWWGRRQKRETVNIGWGGTITHRADFLLCRDPLVEIAGKYKWVKIVVAGDPEIYKMLNKVREEQKMFLPMVRYEDYPHTLMYYDILLAPLEDTHFNNAKSDIKLVDAGAAKIPFVASNVPVYFIDGWEEGGYLVRGQEEWFSALEELVLYEEIREKKGKKCREIAKHRHMNVLANRWLHTYKEAQHWTRQLTSKSGRTQ